ncbi:hypothetical protein R3P38DRAFT_3232899 [Favolaschia claudopus]|uniref:DUF7330 domain-containing protein n=1 Tax=Favolaschia claudopus TaxID=2862362 RepID=A0AAV9ZJ40_9AGAR
MAHIGIIDSDMTQKAKPPYYNDVDALLPLPVTHRSSSRPLPPPYPTPTSTTLTRPPGFGTDLIIDNSELTAPPPPQRKSHVQISRTFGSITPAHFAIDPNQRTPESLLASASEWGDTSTNDSDRYVSNFSSPSIFKRPIPPRVELDVTFGGVDARVDVLPWVGSRFGCPNLSSSATRAAEGCPERISLVVGTMVGNIALRIETPNPQFNDCSTLARARSTISLRALSTFGQIELFLPPTFHGSLTITSALGAPVLSPRLTARLWGVQREVGAKRRFFVGDPAAWDKERGDEVVVGSSWGRVWVGFVGEGEEEEVGAGDGRQGNGKAKAKAKLDYVQWAVWAVWFVIAMFLGRVLLGWVGKCVSWVVGWLVV